jgi:hypothetical protein
MRLDVKQFPVRMRSALVAAMFVGGGVLLTACGGGGGDTPAAQGTNPPPGGGGTTNHAPAISGTAAAQVMQGQAYSFTPTATDADGNSLTFSITGMPAWATLDAATGKLSGTPGAADVRTYSNIVISVSDGQASASLAAFSIQVVATALGSVTLHWTAPTQNTDGTALTNLAGYKVYWGTAPGSYPHSATITNVGLSSYVVDQLTPATWYFSMSALNSTGVESALSNAASKVIQ